MDVLIGKVARELAALEERMDRAFARAFGAGMQLPRRADSIRPAIDVYDTRDATVVRVELAGVDSEDVQLILDGEYLEVSGRRRARYPQEPERHLQMEISQGSFRRVLRLRAPYDAERATAKLTDGILLIELPHRGPRTREIRVETE